MSNVFRSWNSAAADFSSQTISKDDLDLILTDELSLSLSLSLSHCRYWTLTKNQAEPTEAYLVARAMISPVLTSFTVQSRRTAFLPSVQNQVSISRRLRLAAASK
jgi:hypothetical protein